MVNKLDYYAPTSIFPQRGEDGRDTRGINRHLNQRTNGPVNTHLISWHSKALDIQNLENIW